MSAKSTSQTQEHAEPWVNQNQLSCRGVRTPYRDCKRNLRHIIESFVCFINRKISKKDFPFTNVVGGGEGSFLISGTAESDAVRLGKRKRKAPIPADESPSQSSVGGWVRAALGLLQRVSRYRGINRDKGDINAASWFTRPVNPEEAPGYYKIIKNPMDFGTIKRKLEVGQYQNFEAFHEDMLLVRDNCYRYNPPGHDARKDGEEVFSFYEIEYIKMMEKWSNRHHQISPVGSPNVKKLKYDKSPTQDWAALPQQQ